MWRVLALLALLCVGGQAAAEILIREFQGIGRAETEAFMARSPWLVEWHSRPPTAIDEDPAHLEVNLYNVTTGEFLGRVVRQPGVGRGEVLIEQTGRFRFVVQGQATRWQLKVIQIDEDFARRLREAREARDTDPRRRR
jgi:hypothetical protein